MRKQFNEILKIVGVIFLGSFILGGLLTFGARYIRFDQKTSMFEIGDKTKIKGDLYVDGKVGIGTEQPEYRLTADDQKNSDRAAQVFNGKFFGTWIGSQQKDRKHYALNVLTGTTGAGKGGTSALYVRTDGNVGIGTTTPTEKLEVNGNIKISGTLIGPAIAFIPSGMIAMFDGSCPAGWTRFSALDGRVPRGAASYGGTGGSDNHSHHHHHSYSGHTSTLHGSMAAGMGGGRASAVPHSHSYSGTTSTDTTSASSWPPYLNVVWCRRN